MYFMSNFVFSDAHRNAADDVGQLSVNDEPFYANQEEDPQVQQILFKFWQSVDEHNELDD